MKMYIRPLSQRQISRYLAIPDLTADNSDHAVGLLYRKIKDQITTSNPQSELMVYRGERVVSVEDNYDNLLIPKDNISRSSTYTHYVDRQNLLRTHASAAIPDALRKLSESDSWTDVIILVPGLVYRRDVADKKHIGQIHMLDVWRVVKTSSRPLVTQQTLRKAVEGIAKTAAPGWNLRIEQSPHPYTRGGIEVNAVNPNDGRDIEILECGLIKQQVLQIAGLDPATYSGWALGMGLDRLVMTRKDLPDIRYLRSDNFRIAEQMKNLDKYTEVSNQPAIQRDLSYSVPKTYVDEDISQDIMQAMGDQIGALEEVALLAETAYENLSYTIQQRLGIKPNQKNVLVRVTLRDLTRTLTKAEANTMYDTIYPIINKGEAGY